LRQKFAQSFRHWDSAGSGLGFCAGQKNSAAVKMNIAPEHGPSLVGIAATNDFPDARAGIRQKFNQVCAVFAFFLIVLFAI